MARKLTDEELATKRANAKMRADIKGLFSQVPEVRLDAIDALKAAWNYDEPSFNLAEIAEHGPESATLTAMRRDTYKEVINWLINL